MPVHFRIELEFGNVFFFKGENRNTRRKTPWSRVENQQQTQPTYDVESPKTPGHIGGRWVHSSLCQPCSPGAYSKGYIFLEKLTLPMQLSLTLITNRESMSNRTPLVFNLYLNLNNIHSDHHLHQIPYFRQRGISFATYSLASWVPIQLESEKHVSNSVVRHFRLKNCVA